MVHHFRLGVNLLLARLSGRRVPFQLNAHITEACNLRCRYCYKQFSSPGPQPSFATLEKVFREARACGTARVSLEGGEPLVREDIGDIVDLLSDLGLECNINTNGTLVPQKIGLLRRADLLTVSLDGPREVNDAMRGEGSYDKALRAIEAARSRGMRVHVMSVLTRANRGHAGAMLELASRMGFGWLPNSLFFMAGTAEGSGIPEACRIPDDDYRALLDELIAAKRSGAPLVWSRSTLEYVRNWPFPYSRSNFVPGPGEAPPAGFRPLRCQAARYFAVLQSDGELSSCDPMVGRRGGPNAFELGFAEAFRRLGTRGCAACNSIVCSESHRLFCMDPFVILNLLRKYGRAR